MIKSPDIGQNNQAILIISLALLIGVITSFLVLQDTDTESKTYFANTTIVDGDTGSEDFTVGIDTGDNLYFGETFEGSNLTKTIELNSPRKTHLTASSKGNISKLLRHKNNDLYDGGHEFEVMMVGDGLEQGELGYYEGNVTLEFEISNNKVTDQWLELKNWLYSAF